MRRSLFFTLLLAGALTADAADKKIRVLILDGFSNHDWQQTTSLIRGNLEPSGLFDVAVSTAPQTTNAADWEAWRPKFSGCDVVIQTCNDISRGPKWPGPVKKDFADFVNHGGGVYIFHSAENAFVGWKEYEQMVGLCWRKADYGTAIRVNDDGTLARIPPGEGGNTSHGKRGDVLVTRLGDDSIHAGMPRQWLSPDMEVYYFARGPAENVNVLAYARDSKPGQGLLWPVEWTTTYGNGRVYVSTYGHIWRGDTNPPAMRCAAVQTIIPRAVQWLANQPVTIPMPEDFPGTNAVSVRPVHESLPITVGAETSMAHTFSKWEKAIAAFEQMDVTNAPPKGSVVFIGSSTIARWKTLAEDFPSLPVVNRGFGGSEIIDSTHFASRVIFPYEPRTVVLRAGGNDLWASNSVEKVFGDYKNFVETVHAKLPDAKIVFISLSPSLARWTQHEKEKALNALIAEHMRGKSNLQYIETYDVPLGTNGLPRAELFVADKLHFNEDGYKLFTARIRPQLPK